MDPNLAVKFEFEGDFKEYILGKLKKRHFFMFNKLLLITKKTPKGKHITKHYVPVDNCIIWDKNDLGEHHAFQIVRTDSTEKIIFVCSSHAIKENWIAKINEIVCNNIGFAVKHPLLW